MSWISSCRHHLLGEGLKVFVSPAPLQSLKSPIMVGVGLGKAIVSLLFLNYFLELANDLPWGNVMG